MELVHNTAGRCSQKKKDQKENEEPSPVVDKPVPYDEAVKGCLQPHRLTHNRLLFLIQV